MDITISGLWKAFGPVQVFSGLSLVFPAGRTSCLAGPSGSGKTTLLRLMMGLEKPDAGDILGLSGKRLSVVFQEDRLCENLSALSNAHMASRQSRSQEEVMEGLANLGLKGHEHRPVRALSGGMRRRIALLRALNATYDVLLLDEAFKGLDEESKARTIAYTRDRCREKTVIMVAHDETEAAAMGACLFRLEGAGGC